MLCAVVGKPNVSLTGFSPSSANRPRWAHASPAFVRAPVDPLYMIPALRHTVRINRFVVAFALTGMCAAFFGLGQVMGSSRVSHLVREQMSLVGWSIDSVEKDHVRLRTGAAFVNVRVGQALPNGDTVVSVSPQNRMVVLGSGTVVLHSASAGPSGRSP
jgi:hypothetical protein